MKEKTGLFDYYGKELYLHDIIKVSHNAGLLQNQFGYIVKKDNSYEIEWAYSGKGICTDIDYWVKQRGLKAIGNICDDFEQLRSHFSPIVFPTILEFLYDKRKEVENEQKSRSFSPLLTELKLTASDVISIVANHLRNEGYDINKNQIYFELSMDRDDECEYPRFDGCTIYPRNYSYEEERN